MALLDRKLWVSRGDSWVWNSETVRKVYIGDTEIELIERSAGMPPGRILSQTKAKAKIRPSSAAANLQTHPSYTTGVYDNVSLRPSTAAGSRTPDSTGVVQRPATQAAGSRRQWQRAVQEEAKPSDIHKQARRLTLSTVDGIAEGRSEHIKRPGLVQGTAAQVLKSKVGELGSLFACVFTSLHVEIESRSRVWLVYSDESHLNGGISAFVRT